MPIKSGKDSKGAFYRWGATGKKYYYDPTSIRSKNAARAKAARQARAIRASGYRGK